MSPSPNTPMVPLAIIGTGCLFPGAADFRAFWSRVVNRHDAIREVPPSHWDAADYLDADPKSPDRVYAARGGFLDPIAFEPGLYGIPPVDLEATDASQLLGLVVADQALKDCGYSIASRDKPAAPKTIERTRISVILGVTGTLQLVIPLGARLGHPLWKKALAEAGVDAATSADVVARIADGYVPWQENSFPGLLGNVVAGRIANRFDLGGTNCVVDAACASSLSAIHLASMELATGRADYVLTGGVDAFNDIFMFTCFSKTPALSPTGNAKPFDASGDGTVLGEGLGMVVLKRLDDARRDGDRILAVLRGIGTSSDGKGNAIYAPKKEGQIDALRDAYATAGVGPESIELVEAHGTGTRVGDAAEVSALAEVYGATGRVGPWCAVGSIKSQIGHTKAAAGVAGLLKAAAALANKVIPPTIKVTKPLDLLQRPGSPLYVATEKRPWMPSADHPRRAAVSAFGFGGSNFHAVLEEGDGSKREIDWTGDVEILAMAGATWADVRKQLDAVPATLGWDELRRVAGRSRREWRGGACRMLLTLSREGLDLAKALGEAREATFSGPPRPLYSGGEGLGVRGSSQALPRPLTPDPSPPSTGARGGRSDAHIGEGTPGPLAVLFPGQGAQYVGMMRDLVCHFPPAFDAFASAGGRLVDVVYPVPAFTSEAKAAQEISLRATDVAQPALGAVALGAWRVLESFGVRADAFAGHSYGELVALCAAGRLSESALVSLSALRGRLMAEAGREPGAMLAVKAGEADVARVFAEQSLALTLANKNTPTQTVLSGSLAEIDRAAKAFAAAKIGNVRLEVAAAFHTPAMASACAPLRAALDAEPMPAGAPVYANTTGGVYPDDAAAARDLLANQLARPVEWVREIEAMLAAGATTFLEVGPGARLTGMVEAIAKGRASTLALDASSGKASGFADLARCLAALAALGYPVRLDLWDPVPETKPRKPGMTVQLTGANYTRPKEPRPARVAAPLPEPTPVRSTPMNQPSPTPAVDASALTRALELTRESLSALQRMQEQASALHRQFLEGQDHAHQTVHLLVEQQNRLLQASLGVPVALPIAPVAVQAPPQAQRLQPLGLAPTPPPPPAPIAIAAPTPAPVPAASSTHVQSVLLAVIAEKTGYPSEMLELGMTLDADLGIDSIKRVEILSSLQDRLPDAPVVKPEHLGTLHTLADIAAFLSAGATGEPTPSPSGDATKVQQTLLAVIAEKTGYPSEMLELGMTLDADLGIDSIKRVEILSSLQDRLPDAPVVKPEHLGTLHTLADIAAFLAGGKATPAPKPAPVAAKAATNGTHKPPAPLPPSPLERSVVCAAPLMVERQEVRIAPGSEVWLSDDDADLSAAIAASLTASGLRVRRGPCAGMKAWQDAPAALVLVAPRGEVGDAFLADALMATKRAASGLRSGVFLTVARMDGAFGLMGRAPLRTPLDGGLAGLAKTAGREWPESRARALDIAPDIGVAQAAAFVVEELFLTGPSEVGLTAKGKTTLERVPEVVFPGTHTPFQPGEVVVVSGGARGVTAEVAVELAKAFRPTLVLLGRSPEPADEPDWMVGLADEASVKQALARRHPGTSPRALTEQTRDLLAAREIRDTLARIRAAGAEAVYRAVDVRDADQVKRVLAALGPIRGLIHGAGVLADAKIEDKTPEQFAAVYGTKIDGLRSLLAACGDGLRAIVLFSSSTARFGRVAQVDYAIANEVLNKLAWQESARRPGCRVVSFGWGPWDGGMVTPGLKQLFLREGVGVIPLTAGARLVVDELRSAAEGPREVVVLGPAPVAQAVAPAGPHLPPELPLTFERTLDIEEYPVLSSHVIDGRPVLPVALMVEWFAHAAMVQNPGLVFHGCDDLRVLHGVSLEGSLTLRVGATKSSRVAGQFVSSTELRSRRPDGREILHARAEVVLTPSLPAAPAPASPPILPEVEMSAEEVYRSLFHGPALHGIEGIDGIGEAGMTASVRAAPPVNEWMHQPLRQTWLADPLVLDSSFQMMVLWTHEQRGAYSLPVHLGRYRQYRRSFPADGVRVVVTIGRAGDAQAGADIDYVDRAGKLVARCEGYRCVLDPALGRAFERNVLVSV